MDTGLLHQIPLFASLSESDLEQLSCCLQLIELPEGKVVWSGTAGKSSWSRDAVSAVAQQVLDRLIGTMNIKIVAK